MLPHLRAISNYSPNLILLASLAARFAISILFNLSLSSISRRLSVALSASRQDVDTAMRIIDNPFISSFPVQFLF